MGEDDMMQEIKVALCAVLASGVAAWLAATPAAARTLKVTVDSFQNGKMIPEKYAFCAPAAQGHTTAGANISPRISWSKGPAGTKSYVIVLYDTDAPAEQREKMNKEGETLTADVRRKDFFHWILVDIPPKVTSLPEGAESDARVLHGKPATTKLGLRGLNDYTKVTVANDAMKGQYFGYDGPCPPWNDENVHHYYFTVYALSVRKLALGRDFDGPAVMEAIKGKVLAQGEELGLYTQNPEKGAKPAK
jgi:Raf kinase inhibitor-like YbhB/YbcL family protein